MCVRVRVCELVEAFAICDAVCSVCAAAAVASLLLMLLRADGCLRRRSTHFIQQPSTKYRKGCF